MRELNKEYLEKIKARYEKIEMHHRKVGNDAIVMVYIYLIEMVEWLLNGELGDVPGITRLANEDFYNIGESNYYDDMERLDENTAKVVQKQETVKVECPKCGNAQNLPTHMAHGTRICCGCEKEFTTSLTDNLETFDRSTVQI